MKFLVCISVAPDNTAKIAFTSDNTQLNTSGVQYILNSSDKNHQHSCIIPLHQDALQVVPPLIEELKKYNANG